MIKRILILAATAMVALGMSAGVASAKGASASGAEITVDFHGTTVDVQASKDISNVVLEFCDGTTERFEGLSGTTETFSGTGDNAGKTIATIWVKTGSNQSDDGPGYGERFESGADCSTPAPIVESEEITTTPETNPNPPANLDDTQDAVVEEETQVSGGSEVNGPGDATLSVTSGDAEVLGGSTSKAPAGAEVLGASLSQADRLPTTGTSPAPVAFLALTVIGIGIGMSRLHSQKHPA